MAHLLETHTVSAKSQSQIDQLPLQSNVHVPSLCIDKIVPDGDNAAIYSQIGSQIISHQKFLILKFSKEFNQGWIGQKTSENHAITLNSFISLICKETIIEIWGKIWENRKGKRYVEVTEAVLQLVAPQPWAVYKILTNGWEITQGHALSISLALGGITIDRCVSARSLVDQNCDREETEKGETQNLKRVRKGRLRDVFRGNKVMRTELQNLVELRRVHDNNALKPRQRIRKTSRSEWEAIQRASKIWVSFSENTPSETKNNFINQENGSGGDWGKFDPMLNLPDDQNQTRAEYIQLKKKPQISWMLKRIEQVINDRNQEHLIGWSALPEGNRQIGRPAHLVDVGGGRGDLAIAVATSIPNVHVTVIDKNASSLFAGEERAKVLGLTNIDFVMADIVEIMENTKEGIHPKLASIDLVFGLHCCGGLSEMSICLAIKYAAAFVICTCCFRSHPHLALLTNGEPLCLPCVSTETTQTSSEHAILEDKTDMLAVECSSLDETKNEMNDDLDSKLKRVIDHSLKAGLPFQEIQQQALECFNTSAPLKKAKHENNSSSSSEKEFWFTKLQKAKSLQDLSSMMIEKYSEDNKLLENRNENNDSNISTNQTTLDHSLPITSLKKVFGDGNIQLVESTSNAIKDLRMLCTVAESDDSPEQFRAMELVNRSRIHTAKLIFEHLWDSGCVVNHNLILSGRQEEFPFSYSHRNRVLIGSVSRSSSSSPSVSAEPEFHVQG